MSSVRAPAALCIHVLAFCIGSSFVLADIEPVDFLELQLAKADLVLIGTIQRVVPGPTYATRLPLDPAGLRQQLVRRYYGTVKVTKVLKGHCRLSGVCISEDRPWLKARSDVVQERDAFASHLVAGPAILLVTGNCDEVLRLQEGRFGCLSVSERENVTRLLDKIRVGGSSGYVFDLLAVDMGVTPPAALFSVQPSKNVPEFLVGMQAGDFLDGWTLAKLVPGKALMQRAQTSRWLVATEAVALESPGDRRRNPISRQATAVSSMPPG